MRWLRAVRASSDASRRRSPARYPNPTIRKWKKRTGRVSAAVHERQPVMSKTTLSLALSVATIAALGSLAACSGDDNGAAPVTDAAADQTSSEAGTDGGTDAKTDGAETSTPEAGEAGPTEAGEAGPTEAGGEAGPSEGGEAGLIDASIDTGLRDTGLPDVSLDTGLEGGGEGGTTEAGLDGSAADSAD